MTPAEGRRWKKELARDTLRAEKARAKALLLELRAELRELRQKRKQAIADARRICRDGRVTARERAKLLRLEARAALRNAIQAERDAARNECGSRKAIAAGLKDDVARRRETLHAERTYQRQLRRIEAGNRAERRREKKTTRTDRRAESDEAVTVNIPPELLPLWRKVGGSIKGSDRRSRTEAFLQYAHENPDEVIAAHEDSADALIAELEEREAKLAKAARDGGEVPF